MNVDVAQPAVLNVTTVDAAATVSDVELVLAVVEADADVVVSVVSSDAVILAASMSETLQVDAATVVVEVVEVGPPGPSGGHTIAFTRVAAADVSGHRVVTPLADGTVAYADSSSPASLNRPMWVTAGAAASGTEVPVVAFGEMTEPSWSWTPGPVWLGADGALTQDPPTPPMFLQQIGVADTPTSLFVDPQMPISIT